MHSLDFCRAHSELGKRFTVRAALCGLAMSLSLAAAGCGASQMNLVSQAAQITMQPGSESVMVGATAMFSVVATGIPPLTYQWSENGAAIAGATSSTLTTAPTAPGDSGATFSVTVTNSLGSVISNPATLTVLFAAPRAPQPADIRFQQVDSPSTVNGYAPFEFTNVQGGLEVNFGNLTGTPLTVGDNCGPGMGQASACAWLLEVFSPPAGSSGLNVNYVTGNTFSNFARDFNAQINPNTVVNFIQIERANDTYAFSAVSTTQTTGFNSVSQSVPVANLQAAATQAGLNSQVVSAVSFDQGAVFYLAYGWQSDPGTIYEASVATATIDTIVTTASGLAAQGYIITAIGGEPADGFVIVGTRVKGDTAPRPFRAVVDPAIVPIPMVKSQLFDAGYAIVGLVFNEANGGFTIWMGEK